MIAIPASSLSLISWTPSQITSRKPQDLCSDLEKCGVLREDAKVLVADLLAAVGRADDLKNWGWYEKARPLEAIAAAALTAAGAAAILLIGTRM